MPRYLAFWLLVVTTVFALGCSEQPHGSNAAPRTGRVRSAAGAPRVTLQHSPNPSIEGDRWTLVAEIDSSPSEKASFAYDCPPDTKEPKECKGQFPDGIGVEWIRVESALWRATLPVGDPVTAGQYPVVLFTELGTVGPSTQYIVKKDQQAPCCTGVKSFALSGETPSPSNFGTPVVFAATFTANPGATDFTTSNVEFVVDGVDKHNVRPREVEYGTGKYIAYLTLPLLEVGQHDVSAYLAFSLRGSTVHEAHLAPPHVVQQLVTATTVTGPPTSNAGDSVTFTAHLTPGIPIGGQVDFFDNTITAIPFATSSVVPNQESVSASTSALSAGGHSIIAVYRSNAGKQVKGSQGSLSHQVAKRASSMTLTSSTNPAPVNQPVTFRATVNCPAGAPVGSVTFSFGDGTSANVPLNAGGAQQDHAFAAPSAGYAVTASWGGDAKCNGSSAPQLSGTPLQVVTSAGAAVAVSGPSAVSYGDNPTFRATVTAAAGAPPPTGDVQFAWLDGVTPRIFATSQIAAGAAVSAPLPTLDGRSTAYTITAEYLGNGVYGRSSSTTSLTINPRPTALSLATNKPGTAGAVYGEPVTFTATVTRAPGGTGLNPTGNVTFYDGGPNGTVLGGGAVALGVSGAAALTVASLTATNHNIVAVFTPTTGQPAANFRPSSNAPAPLVQTVKKAATEASANTSNTPAAIGAPVTFTLTVSPVAPGTEPAGGATIPTGATVSFKENGVSLGTPVPAGGNSWTLTVSSLPVGSHAIVAEYSGNASFGSSLSNFTQVVQAGVSSIALSSSGTPSTFGEAVKFTAQVTKPGVTVPTGNVVFKDGAVQLGSVALVAGSASISVSDLAAGAHAIQATFETATATFTQTVKEAETATTLTSVPNPSVLGQTAVLTAKVTSAAGATATGSVVFKANGVAIATRALDATGTATAPFASPSGGTHVLTAEYAGDKNFSPSSGLVNQTVNRANTTLALTATANPTRVGANVTFTATVSPVAPATTIPSGSVVFSEGVIVLDTVTLGANGSASFTTSTLALGAHTITASFAQTPDFGASTANLAHLVSENATDISVTTTPSPSLVGVSVTVTATLKGATKTPTGKVTFKSGTTPLGNATVDASGKASVTTSTIPFGENTIVATYEGDPDNDAGLASATHSVLRGVTSITCVSSAISAPAGTSVSFVAMVSAGGASITGEVEFLDDDIPLGTTAVSGGSATFSTASLAVGTHPITARYLGSPSLAGSTTTTVLEQVIVAPGVPGPANPGGPGNTPPPVTTEPQPTTPSVTPGVPVGGGGDGGGCATSTGPASGPFGFALLAVAMLLAARRRR